MEIVVMSKDGLSKAMEIIKSNKEITKLTIQNIGNSTNIELNNVNNLTIVGDVIIPTLTIKNSNNITINIKVKDIELDICSNIKIETSDFYKLTAFSVNSLIIPKSKIKKILLGNVFGNIEAKNVSKTIITNCKGTFKIDYKDFDTSSKVEDCKCERFRVSNTNGLLKKINNEFKSFCEIHQKTKETIEEERKQLVEFWKNLSVEEYQQIGRLQQIISSFKRYIGSLAKITSQNNIVYYLDSMDTLDECLQNIDSIHNEKNIINVLFKVSDELAKDNIKQAFELLAQMVEENKIK